MSYFQLAIPTQGVVYSIRTAAQCAAEGLEAASDVASSARETHAAYCTGLLEKMDGSMKSDRQLEALDEIEADIENVRVAWR
jgi:hypothetical protein